MDEQCGEDVLLDIDIVPSLLKSSPIPESSSWSRSLRSNYRRLLYSIGVLTVMLMVFVSTAIYLFSDTHFRTNQALVTTNTDCGTSPSKARELGCKFDIMMNGWVPLACYNEALSEKYLAQNGFHFYTDAYAQDEVSLDVVRQGEWSGLYTGWEHHFRHCGYMWKTLVLAVETGSGVYDSSSSSFDHTAHCSEMMFEDGRMMALMDSPSVGNESFIEPGYLSCWKPTRSTTIQH